MEKMGKTLHGSMGQIITMDYGLVKLVQDTELVIKFQITIKAIKGNLDLTNTGLVGTDLATTDTVDLVNDTDQDMEDTAKIT